MATAATISFIFAAAIISLIGSVSVQIVIIVCSSLSVSIILDDTMFLRQGLSAHSLYPSLTLFARIPNLGCLPNRGPRKGRLTNSR